MDVEEEMEVPETELMEEAMEGVSDLWRLRVWFGRRGSGVVVGSAAIAAAGRFDFFFLELSLGVGLVTTGEFVLLRASWLAGLA